MITFTVLVLLMSGGTLESATAHATGQGSFHMVVLTHETVVACEVDRHSRIAAAKAEGQRHQVLISTCGTGKDLLVHNVYFGSWAAPTAPPRQTAPTAPEIRS